jgi:hypothetical protein
MFQAPRRGKQDQAPARHLCVAATFFTEHDLAGRTAVAFPPSDRLYVMKRQVPVCPLFLPPPLSLFDGIPGSPLGFILGNAPRTSNAEQRRLFAGARGGL